jgi:hypothetical protein
MKARICGWCGAELADSDGPSPHDVRVDDGGDFEMDEPEV